MPLPDRPEARPLEAQPFDDHGTRKIALLDPDGLFDGALVLPPLAYHILTLLDGTRTPPQLAAALATQGIRLDEDQLRALLDELDQHYCLESPRAEARRRALASAYDQAEARPASHAGGVYPAAPGALRSFLQQFFDDPRGPIQHHDQAPARVAALVAPHIDYRRGNVAYAWAYHALAAQTAPPPVYVILGTSHQALRQRYALTRKHYETPLGTMRTDAPLLDALTRRLGDRFSREERAHQHEHSIELQAVMLAHAVGTSATLLPILCGSLHDLTRRDPRQDPALNDFLGALAEAIRADGREVCFIAGVDLAHIGPHFGDAHPPSPEDRARLEARDRETMRYVCAGDAQGFFADLARDQNARRVCGFAPLYSLLRLREGARGRLTYYGQAITPPRGSIVSFASAVFPGEGPP